MERLDRAMSNDQWRALFPEGTVRTLPRTYSDHSPLIIYTQGKLKLNTDGSSRGDPGQSGFGGLFRDEVGTWVWGYFGYLGSCTSLESELWRIYRALTIIMQKGLTNIDIETDSQTAIELIRDGSAANSPYRALIEDANFLLRRCQCTLKAIPREANQSVDALANLGVNQHDHTVFLEDPPSFILSFLITDMSTVSSSRD